VLFESHYGFRASMSSQTNPAGILKYAVPGPDVIAQDV
jgi:hypothetical protein